MFCSRRAVGTAVAAWLCATAVGFCQAPPKVEPPRVMATATSVVHLKPDAARVNFNVVTTEGFDKSARAGNESACKRMKEALAALKLGGTEVEVHALPTSMSTMVATAADLTTPPAVQAKRATTAFQVNVRDKDLDKLREAVAKIAEVALENGGRGAEVEDYRRSFRLPRGLPGVAGAEEPEHVNGPSIEWLATISGEARRDAIRRAVKDAMADAEAAAGTNKLNVIDIHVDSNEQMPSSVRSMISYPFGSESSVAGGGPIKVKVEVRVTCSY